MPDSIIVGTSGRGDARFSEVTASGRALPARMTPRMEGRFAIIDGICPPTRSMAAGAAPL